jgi:hypothetical protein
MIRAALFSALLAASMLAAPAAADSSFAGAVSGCPLIVLAWVTVRSDGGITLHVEQVLKGHAGETLRFPASTSAVEPGWARAVVAFEDPSTIARGVTFAWHVSASGALDPERLEQFPGTPQTLDAMLAWFGRMPATDAALPAAGDAPAADWRLALLGLAGGLAALAGAVRYRRRSDDRRFR